MRARVADGLAAAAIVAALALHVRFCVLDVRPPTDLGHYYDGVRALATGSGSADTPYAALLAGLVRVFGPSAALFEVVDGVWLAIGLVGLRAAARRVGGPWAGAAAVLLATALPQTHEMARTHWIHHPEAMALLGALGLRGPAGAVLLAFGLTTRPTGLAFGLPVAAALLLDARGRAWTAAATVAGLAFVAPSLPAYLARKAADAPGYAASVGDPLVLALGQLGRAGAVVLAILAPFGLRKAPEVAVAAAWVVGGFVAVAVYQVGPDNFPLAGLGLALLGGVGAAARPALGVGLAAGLAVAMQGATLVHERLLGPVDAALRPATHAGPLNWLRVRWGAVAAEDLVPVVARACTDVPAGERCVVLAERGLFNPSWEDGGTFGLWLAGARDVTVVTPPVLWSTRGQRVGAETRVHAVVDVACREGVAPGDGGRFSRQDERFAEVRGRVGGRPAALVDDPATCTWTWYAAPLGGLDVDQLVGLPAPRGL